MSVTHEMTNFKQIPEMSVKRVHSTTLLYSIISQRKVLQRTGLLALFSKLCLIASADSSSEIHECFREDGDLLPALRK